MAIQSGITVRWKELAMGGNPPSIAAGTYDKFKIALYDSTASLTVLSTSLYSAAIPGEISASNGAGVSSNYTAGGQIITVLSVSVAGSTAYITFNSASWTSATFAADGCLIYNTETIDGTANRVLAVIDFGGTKTATNGTFSITMPAKGASTSIIRLA
jgi:hypothetical protein